MSGTSADGLDMAYCEFKRTSNKWNYRLEQAITIPYSSDWQNLLNNLINASGIELVKVHVELGKFIGKQVKQFIETYKLKVDFIASHGHTVFHQPQHHITYQIGSGAHIQAIVQKPVVCDFRMQDVALGGQGAPLVPVGDALLFSEYEYCLNIGGIANVSFEKNSQRVAHDICPANIVLNYLASRKGLPYDANGTLAQQGKPIPEILTQLNAIPFYKQSPPKSLGKEWVETFILPILSKNYSIEDLSATFCEHIAQQVAQSCPQKGKMLVTGGGAYHLYLIEKIRQYAHWLEIIIPEKKIIDFKEALIFAFLGVLSARKEKNCWSSVTGAQRDSCSGVWYY